MPCNIELYKDGGVLYLVIVNRIFTRLSYGI